LNEVIILKNYSPLSICGDKIKDSVENFTSMTHVSVKRDMLRNIVNTITIANDAHARARTKIGAQRSR
jgi:hypothetical protein